MERIINRGELLRTPRRRVLYDALIEHDYPYGMGCHRTVGGATNVCCMVCQIRPGGNPNISARINESGWPFIREGVIDNFYYVIAVNDGYGYMQHSEYNALSRLDANRRHLSGAHLLYTERKPCRSCQDRLSQMTRQRANILYTADYPSTRAREVVRTWRRLF